MFVLGVIHNDTANGQVREVHKKYTFEVFLFVIRIVLNMRRISEIQSPKNSHLTPTLKCNPRLECINGVKSQREF